MKLYDYIKMTNEDDKCTVWDNTYEMESYFYNSQDSEWDRAMLDVAKAVDIVEICERGIIVDLSGAIESKLDKLKEVDLFYSYNIDDIMDDMMSILSGNVSEEWMIDFAKCLNS